MKLLSFVTGLVALSTSVSAFTIPNFEDGAAVADHALEKRAFLSVVGVPGATQPRLEVRQLEAKTNQWTLFMLAMRTFHNKPQTAKNGYYQIAGIHGVPKVNWDTVGQCSACTSAVGYCPHDSILFLGWHRAYVALFEQEMVKVAKNIASQYPAATRAAMQSAAASLRLPFWDWAAHAPNGGPTLPTLMTNAQVTVNGPTGSVTFTNPLHHHVFKNPGQLLYTPFNKWTNTLRYPTSSAVDATSDMSKAIAALNNVRGNMQTQVYNMFSTCDEFVEVGSDEAGQSSVQCSNSIENIHNTIHTVSGGAKNDVSPGGHMTFLAEAAFDPLFWLHHCNVDRQFAMWQALYPDSYGGSQVAKGQTWTIAKGSTQNANSPLTPFHKNAAGDFWTTNDVKNTNVFHYTYPEFVNTSGTKAAIASIVNKLYGPQATAPAGSTKKRNAAPEPQAESATETSTATSTASSASSVSTSASASATVDATPFKADNGSLYQYVANIATNRYALGGSYNIYLFDSPPASEDPASWVFDENLVGPMGVLASPGMTGDLVIVGSVPLTTVLQDQVIAGGLADLSSANVVPYLTKSLVWRVAGPNGGIVDPETISDFEISVWASTATPPTEFELPVWSKFIPLAEITKSKAGGATAQTINLPPVAA